MKLDKDGKKRYLLKLKCYNESKIMTRELIPQLVGIRNNNYLLDSFAIQRFVLN